MKILTVSDEIDRFVYSPNIKERFKDVDLVLSCGDLTFDYLEYIVTLLNVPLFYVIGNHPKEVKNSDGGGKMFPGGCTNIDNRIIEHDSLLIGGLEGSMRYNSTEYQYTEFGMRMKILGMKPKLALNKMAKGKPIDILITHAPPYKIHDGEDRCHTGFTSFLKFMDLYKPRYLIHGHKHVYHSNEVTETVYNDTTVINTCGYKVIEV